MAPGEPGPGDLGQATCYGPSLRRHRHFPWSPRLGLWLSPYFPTPTHPCSGLHTLREPQPACPALAHDAHLFKWVPTTEMLPDKTNQTKSLYGWLQPAGPPRAWALGWGPLAQVQERLQQRELDCQSAWQCVLASEGGHWLMVSIW